MRDSDWQLERHTRALNRDNCLHLGVGFLDDAIGFIKPTDLVLIGARTGIGKTELATAIAESNAAKGMRVHFFALEADRGEIEARILYREIANEFFRTDNRISNCHLNYRDWYQLSLPKEVYELEERVLERAKTKTTSMHTIYSEEGMRVDDFIATLEQIRHETDLVIVDHLHYFDYEDDSENNALRTAITKIKNATIFHRRPIILLSHLRKSDKISKQEIPDLDDFHGTSDIPKKANIVITLAPANINNSQMGDGLLTYMRVSKFRTFGAISRYAAVCSYDPHRNKYVSNYYLYTVDKFGGVEIVRDRHKFPFWAKNAIEVRTDEYEF